jgi:osmoprotectant transport system permease protein
VSYLLDPANWDITDYQSIPNLLLDHLYITGVSLAIALAIALPLALLISRYRWLYLPIITAAGVVYTLPSLAVVAILVPFTGLSATTIIIPLIAYAQLVLIRNMVAAITGVDPALVEVGRAMGMNGWQLQVRVILPLALPVIIAGVRVTAVTTIGIATIGALVGADNLGDLIFSGIANNFTAQIVAGAILVSALALVADLALLAVQALLSRGRSVSFASS